jgi:hypothetical protein
VATKVKNDILQRSKQVKTGIRGTRGHKSFTAFGTQELEAFVNVRSVGMFDLTELKPLSIALNGAALHSHQEAYQLHRRATTDMEVEAKRVLSSMVNPVDEVNE